MFQIFQKFPKFHLFGKVVKHELLASAMLYGVVLGLGLLFAFGTYWNHVVLIHNSISALLSFSFWSSAGLLSILALLLFFYIHTAIRYQNAMFGAEGALSFSLPVEARTLVLGKFCAALIYGICIFILIGILIYALISGTNTLFGNELLAENNMINTVTNTDNANVNAGLLLMFFLFIFEWVNTLSRIFAAVTLANLPRFARYNAIFAIVFFFVGGWIESFIMNTIFSLFSFSQDSFTTALTPLLQMQDATPFFGVMSSFLWQNIVIALLLCAAHLWVSIWLAKKYTILS